MKHVNMTTQMKSGRLSSSKQQLAIPYHNAISCSPLDAGFVTVDTIACYNACQNGDSGARQGTV